MKSIVSHLSIFLVLFVLLVTVNAGISRGDFQPDERSLFELSSDNDSGGVVGLDNNKVLCLNRTGLASGTSGGICREILRAHFCVPVVVQNEALAQTLCDEDEDFECERNVGGGLEICVFLGYEYELIYHIDEAEVSLYPIVNVIADVNDSDWDATAEEIAALAVEQLGGDLESSDFSNSPLLDGPVFDGLLVGSSRNTAVSKAYGRLDTIIDIAKKLLPNVDEAGDLRRQGLLPRIFDFVGSDLPRLVRRVVAADWWRGIRLTGRHLSEISIKQINGFIDAVATEIRVIDRVRRGLVEYTRALRRIHIDGVDLLRGTNLRHPATSMLYPISKERFIDKLRKALALNLEDTKVISGDSAVFFGDAAADLGNSTDPLVQMRRWIDDMARDIEGRMGSALEAGDFYRKNRVTLPHISLRSSDEVEAFVRAVSDLGPDAERVALQTLEYLTETNARMAAEAFVRTLQHGMRTVDGRRQAISRLGDILTDRSVIQGNSTEQLERLQFLADKGWKFADDLDRNPANLTLKKIEALLEGIRSGPGNTFGPMHEMLDGVRRLSVGETTRYVVEGVSEAQDCAVDITRTSSGYNLRRAAGEMPSYVKEPQGAWKRVPDGGINVREGSSVRIGWDPEKTVPMRPDLIPGEHIVLPLITTSLLMSSSSSDGILIAEGASSSDVGVSSSDGDLLADGASSSVGSESSCTGDWC
jgi:hypothetical protein